MIRLPSVRRVFETIAGAGMRALAGGDLAVPAARGSMVVLDVDGALQACLACPHADDARPVYRFSPTGPDVGTHRHNPLARIAAQDDVERRWVAVARLADQCLAPTPQTEHLLGFGRLEMSKEIFMAACRLALLRARERGDEPTLGEVRDIVFSDPVDRLAGYHALARECLFYDDPATARLWEDITSTDGRTLAVHVHVLLTFGLAAWAHPSVRHATAASDFDFATFRARSQRLHVAVSEGDLEILTPLLRMLFSDLLTTLWDHEPDHIGPHTLTIVLDEPRLLVTVPQLEQEHVGRMLAHHGWRVVVVPRSDAALASIDDVARPSSVLEHHS